MYRAFARRHVCEQGREEERTWDEELREVKATKLDTSFNEGHIKPARRFAMYQRDSMYKLSGTTGEGEINELGTRGKRLFSKSK